MKYAGDQNVADVVLVNASKPGLGPGQPLVSEVENGLTYELYRVATTFQTQFDFRDFPFDQQVLQVTIAHRFLPSAQVIYVVDTSRQVMTQEDLLQAGLNAEGSINEIGNWQADAVHIYRETSGTTSTLGLPGAAAGASGMEFSQLTSSVEISRELQAFLVKNLLPLLLLATVTYLSLFISHGQTGVRVSFGITGILTGVVLLSDVTDQLPDVSYTVAIEYAYFAFIFLSAATIMVGMLGDRFYDARDLSALHKLDWISRIAYPLVCVMVGVWYWQHYF